MTRSCPARICNQSAVLHHRERAGSNWLVCQFDFFLIVIHRPIAMPQMFRPGLGPISAQLETPRRDCYHQENLAWGLVAE
jgi:hypothetical protein